MQGLKSNTGRFKSWDVDLEAHVQEQDAFSVLVALAIFLSYEVILLRCYLRHVHRRCRGDVSGQGVVLPRLYALAYVAIIRPYALFVQNIAWIIMEFCLLIVRGCGLV